MPADIQGLAIGSTSTNTALEALLGSICSVDGAIPSCPGRTLYRLVKTADATSIANGRPVTYASITSRTVNGAAPAASALRGTVAGLAVLSPLFADYATGTVAAAGTYFWVAINGPAYSSGATGAGALGGALATQTGGNLGTTAAAAFNTNIGVATGTGTAAGQVVIVDLTA